jgi:hypothetical protein
MNPISKFFDEIIPAYEYYIELSNKKDNKKFMLQSAALQVANLLFHYRESIQTVLPSKKLTGNDITPDCPDYNVIGRVFDKSKHHTLRNPGNLVNDESAIEETIVSTYYPRIVDGQYSQEWYGVMQARVMINFTDRESRDLLEIATNVINYWADFLDSNNLAPKHLHKHYHYQGNDFLTPEEADQLGMGLPIHPSELGGARIIMIGRFYRLQENKWYRLPFTDGENGPAILPNPTDDWTQPGLKVQWNFPDMNPPKKEHAE